MKKAFLLACTAVVLILGMGCAPRAVYVRPVCPPPKVEVMVPAPHSRAVWVPGHWTWNRWHREYVWVPGHWRR